jgi:hypothetical protein
MKYPIPKLLPSLLAVALVSASAHALEAPLTATHRIVDVQQHADGQTTVTLDITASNTGTGALSGVTLRLLPGIPFGAAPDEAPLAIGPIAAGGNAKVQWSLDIPGPVETDMPIMQRLIFAGEATGATGELLTFPVNSLEVAP